MVNPSTEKELSTHKILNVCLVSLLIMIIVDIAIGTWLYDISIPLIAWLQAVLGPAGITVFEYITLLGDDLTGSFVIIFAFSLFDTKISYFCYLIIILN